LRRLRDLHSHAISSTSPPARMMTGQYQTCPPYAAARTPEAAPIARPATCCLGVRRPFRGAGADPRDIQSTSRASHGLSCVAGTIPNTRLLTQPSVVSCRPPRRGKIATVPPQNPLTRLQAVAAGLAALADALEEEGVDPKNLRYWVRELTAVHEGIETR
jgi:hypothetical protein